MSPLARRSLLSSALASFVLSRVLSPASLSPEASHPCTEGWVPRRLGSGSCVHPPRSLPLSLSFSFSPASLARFFPSVRPSFLPPARERSSPSGSKPENLRKTLLSRLDISRLPNADQFHDHRDLRHLCRSVA